MRLLLDTHAFLWFLLDDPQLSMKGEALIGDSTNDILVSPATLWEIAIKISIGKYSLPEPFATFMERELAINGFEILHISVRHTELVSSLPFHHKDPFDRMLVAQSMGEQVPILSVDDALDDYGIDRLW
ncbi:MAG TPA: type II toxin-antitoxin system VapC family toxin [Planctomycetaceae bacterium]|nr:type II toxin-antitoxin system VapC family toxin [Planctomycetaceae bacterium]